MLKVSTNAGSFDSDACSKALYRTYRVSAAQARLLNSSVLIIGAGGLGSPAALYLAAAGAGRIGVVDQDVVELNNLHRQIIHTEARIGKHKAESAADACRQLNSTNKVAWPSCIRQSAVCACDALNSNHSWMSRLQFKSVKY